MNLRLRVIVPVYPPGVMTWHPDNRRRKALPAGSSMAMWNIKRLDSARCWVGPGTRVRVLQTWTDDPHSYWEIEVIEGPSRGLTTWVDEDEAEPLPALEQLAEAADEAL